MTKVRHAVILRVLGTHQPATESATGAVGEYISLSSMQNLAAAVRVSYPTHGAEQLQQ